MKKFGEKKDKKDGKILTDEEDEAIVVTWSDYVYVMTNFYGHWVYFLIIFVISATSYSFVVQHNYIIAQWANSE